MDVGKLKLELRCSEVREVVKDVVNLFSLDANNHQNVIKYLTSTTHLPPSPP
jgi:hypothetical protein